MRLSFTATNMTSESYTVLPGESVPAQHVNLKLGPGLLQIQSQSAKDQISNSTIIATRAGTVNHSANNSKWWVESNSRRVSFSVCFQAGMKCAYDYWPCSTFPLHRSQLWESSISEVLMATASTLGPHIMLCWMDLHSKVLLSETSPT